MEFLAPGFLFLLLATPLVYVLRNARRDMKHSLVRLLAFVLLILALARPAQITSSSKEHMVLLVDQSASISTQGNAEANALFDRLRKQLPNSAALHRIDFGSVTQSPLGDALRAAAAMIPIGEPGSVVIASDGAATQANWFSSSELSARGIPIHVMPLETTATDPRIVGVQAQGEWRIGHPAQIAVQVEGQATEAQVSLYSGDSTTPLVSSESFILNQVHTVVLGFEPKEAGFLDLQARLKIVDGTNQHANNDIWQQSFAVQDPIPVLYLGQRIVDGLSKLGETVGPGFQFEGGQNLNEIQASDYPLVILDDRPADSVPANFQQQLSTAVTEAGTGLLMSGGTGSFGPGGWAETPVADVLPVEFVQKEEKRDPSTTLVVIIDTSGSMGGNRVNLAKEVARLAIHRLLPHDKAGIVEFYGAKHWAAPIQPASNIIELERALNRMSAGGGTVILPAIEEAFYAMQNVQTRYKHVLVLTDGGVEAGDFESLLRNMSDKGITTSTVLIGSQAHSEFLVNMSNWGKGRFYNVPNRFNLPEVILKQPASAKLPAYRPGSHQVVGRGSRAWWSETDPSSIPALSGYVETRARPGAEVLLETAQGSHPVFASWRYGLGRVSALTTEPVGPGSSGWQDWDGLGAFLAQLLQRTADDGFEDFQFRIERQGSEAILTASRRRPSNATPTARVLDNELQLTPQFHELAPGLFEARLLLAPEHAIHLEAESSLHTKQVTRLVMDAFSDHAPELQVSSEQKLPLLGLASATNGQVLDEDSERPNSSSGTALALREYAPWLLVFGLLLFLFDLYYRRRPSYQGVIA
ncbi:MAG: VWA domain-containing protein [Planctomycetes bacterium]|nr:VWA domain-containing protein [Planctomycetota bacterium]